MTAARLALAALLLLSGCGGCQPNEEGSKSDVGASGGALREQLSAVTPGKIRVGPVPVITTARDMRPSGGNVEPPPPAAASSGQPPTEAGPGESDCIVVIDANPDYGPPPLSVAFSAEAECSGGQPSYHWEFGDGPASSNESNPAHTYTRPGDYTAKVTVKGPGNATASDEIDITVEEEGAEAAEPTD